jgi:hypothetical protein
LESTLKKNFFFHGAFQKNGMPTIKEKNLKEKRKNPKKNKKEQENKNS